jgi:protein O-mannosyl-transferase
MTATDVTSAASPQGREDRHVQTYTYGCLIVLAGALTYANSMSGPLLFDDQSSILTNPQIRHLWPVVDALAPPRGGVLASRPIVNLSFAINYAIGGLSVRGYHIGNVTLHIVSALVLFGIIRRTLLTSTLRDRFAAASGGIALACALIWVVHPLQTESVDYVTQRTELMMGLFYLLTLYCAIRATASTAADRWRAAAVVSCLLGVGCKESMATVPLTVFLYDRTFLFDSMREAWRRRKGLYVGLAAGWLEVAAMLTSHNQTVGFGTGVSAWTYLLNQAQMIARYLQLTLWPHSLVLDYGAPRSLGLMEVLPEAVLVVALLILTVVALVVRRAKWAGFLGAWFFIGLAPTSSFVPIVSEVGAERRMYLPLAGIVVFLVVAAYQLLEKRLRRGAIPAAAAALSVVVVALAYTTVRRNHDYASAVSLLQTSVDRWPHGRARFNLAAVLKQEGRGDEAMAQLRAAVADNPQAQYVLGSELYDRGQFDEAIDELRAFIISVAHSPASRYDTIAARNLIGLCLAQQSKLTEAVEEFELALQLDPENAALHGNLAFILLQRQNFAGARRHYEEQLRGRAGSAFLLTNLGVALQELGQFDQAKERFRQALAIDRNYLEARSRLERLNLLEP